MIWIVRVFEAMLDWVSWVEAAVKGRVDGGGGWFIDGAAGIAIGVAGGGADGF